MKDSSSPDPVLPDRARWESMAAAIQRIAVLSDIDRIVEADSISSYSGESLDLVDRISADIAVASARRRSRMMVVFPDTQPHRAGAIVSALLLDSWLEAMKAESRGTKILYLGQTAGIRKQLSEIVFRPRAHGPSVRMARLFSQASIERTTQQETVEFYTDWEAFLPKVIYSYDPTDVATLLHEVNPSLIAIDASFVTKTDWFESALAEGDRQGLPIVTWLSNPLSPVVTCFQSAHGAYLRWPLKPIGCSLSAKTGISADSLVECFTADSSSAAKLFSLELGDQVGQALSASYLECARNLVRVRAGADQRLLRDAVSIVWRELRLLERLSVPLAYHESEAPNYWGLIQHSELEAGVARFSQALSSFPTSERQYLDRAIQAAGAAHSLLTGTEPPLWRALVKRLVEPEPEDTSAMVVFPGPANRQLFESAILAKKGITRSDLEKNRTILVDAQSLTNRQTETFKMGVNTDGDSSERATIYLSDIFVLQRLSARPQLFNATRIAVYAYPHQLPFVKKCGDRIGSLLSYDLGSTLNAIRDLDEGADPTTLPRPQTRRYVEIGRTRPAPMIPVGTRLPPLPHLPMMRDVDKLAELSWLMGTTEEPETTSVLSEGLRAKPGTSERLTESPWVESALEVRFVERWLARFATDASIYRIQSEGGPPRAVMVHVSSLVHGDRVLFIRGQQRQSMYELILSRVHGMKEFDTHLRLVRQWPKDFSEAYHNARREYLINLDRVLEELQNGGSRITSVQTLHSWIQGRILCPQDPQDLRRLARFLRMDFVGENWEAISRAAHRLASLHIALSLRLGAWLARAAEIRSSYALDMDEVVDPTLGLTLADFLDAFQVLSVESVEEVGGPFMRANLGNLERVH